MGHQRQPRDEQKQQQIKPTRPELRIHTPPLLQRSYQNMLPVVPGKDVDNISKPVVNQNYSNTKALRQALAGSNLRS
jgi:hemoglobin-like flavoprotein